MVLDSDDMVGNEEVVVGVFFGGGEELGVSGDVVDLVVVYLLDFLVDCY